MRRIGFYFLATSLFFGYGATANNDQLMFTYGTDIGDTALPAGDDTSTAVIPISKTFYFFDTPYNSLFVNMNGAVSFVDPLTTYTPSAFPLEKLILFTPYWGDVDTRNGGTVMYREETEDPEALAMADNVIRQTFVAKQDFTSSWLFIVTWDQVAYYGSTTPTIINTFQCVLVSGDDFAAVIFNYDVIEWTTGKNSGGDPATGLGGSAAQVGFNAGDGTNFYAIPESQTADVINVTKLSNIGVPGRFVFEVDEAEIVDVKCGESGDVTLYPDVVTMMGGKEIDISGPCFDPATDQIVCKFGPAQISGVVISLIFARCVAPLQGYMGYNDFALSLDNGATFPYVSRIQTVLPIGPTNADVFRENPTSSQWSNYDDGVTLSVTWNTDVLSVDTVDVVIFTYYENIATNTTSLEEGVMLVGAVPYSDGRADFVRPQVNLSTADKKLFGFIAVKEAVPQDEIPVLWSEPGDLQWLYPVDSVDWCRNWTALQLNDLEFLEDRTPCPCSIRQANRDFSRYFPLPICREDLWGVNPTNCVARPGAYHCVVARNISVHGAGQECCYNQAGVLLEDRLGDTGFGYAHRAFFAGVDNPQGAGQYPFFSHFFQDIIPDIQCCKYPALDPAVSEDDAAASCARYGSVRPSESCAAYRVPNLAAVYGTTHFVTPDGFNYTFNGHGEYLLLKTNDGKFILQGRIEQIAPNITASALTAIAATLGSGDIIHIQPSAVRGISVFIQGNNSFERLDPAQVRNWNLNGTVVEFTANVSQNGIRVLFSDGIGIKVHVAGPIMRLLLMVPQQYRDDTLGLLGRFNGDATDDLALSDGTTLPSDSSTETIHDTFGPSWLIDGDEEGESLFYYLPGYSTETFTNASYTPTYVAPSSGRIEACEQSVACSFDYQVTDMPEVALETLAAEEQLAKWSDDFDPTKCVEIETQPNGYVAPESSNDVGGQVVFACDDCYEIVGESSLTCLDTLIWDGEPPRCEAQSNGTCAYPTSPANGNIELNACGRVARFSCVVGYTLIGGASVTCDDNGSWTSDFPVCDLEVIDATTVRAMTAQGNGTAAKCKSGRCHLWWLIILVVVVVAVIVIIVVVVCRRRKKDN